MNIYEALSMRCPEIHTFLELYGDRSHPFELASDYEKFYQLCVMMPKLMGNPIYKRLTEVARELVGEFLDEKNAQALWRAFNGDAYEIIQTKPPALRIKLYRTLPASAHRVTNLWKFEKPNPYNVSVARERAARGEMTPQDEALLAAQEIREAAQSAKARSERLVIKADNTPLQVLCQMLEYLEGAGLLPGVMIALDGCSPQDAEQLYRLYASGRVELCICLGERMKESIRAIAKEMPIGCISVCTEGDDIPSAERIISELATEWTAEGTAPEGAGAILQENFTKS